MASELQPFDTSGRGFQGALRDIARYLGLARATPLMTPEAATASPRTVSVQAVDRNGRPRTGRWWVRLMFGNAEWNTSATQTVAVTSGAVAVVLVADRVYDVLTNDDGTAEVTITAAAGTYYMTGSIGGEARSSGAIAIT